MALKNLDVSSEPESNVEFLTQVSMDSRLKHDNLVELQGYYVEGNLFALAYEFAIIGLVPTIRYLHRGHLSLIQKAHKHSQLIAVSIYVNLGLLVIKDYSTDGSRF